MAVQVRIIGVGAFVAPAGGGDRRPYRHGATPTVDDKTARALVRDGVAEYVEQAETGGSEPESKSTPEKGLDQQTVRELRATAAERGVDLGDATKRADILAKFEQAETGGRPQPVLADLDDEALLALAVERELDVPRDADREALLSLLGHVGDAA